jgi:hypothetical protein
MLLRFENSTKNNIPKDSSVIAENVQGDSGGKGNILGGYSIGSSEKKKFI